MQRVVPVTGRLRLPGVGATAEPRFQHCSVSGFPLPCLKSCIPYSLVSSPQELLGLPKFLCASLPACHGLRTPADLAILASERMVWCCLRCALTPSASATSAFRSCTSTSGCAVTPAAYRIRCLRFVHLVHRESPHDSAMDARLATGGGLALTRQGLSPCKRRQALLGAITPGIRRGGKREQSGRCTPSPSG
jgi:hypothetical protein